MSAAQGVKTTAQVLVDCLKAEGVEVVFGIPGEENLDLMFAIKEAGIRFIPTRHEQGAAFMADVYGRLTGRAGVCLATLGPGATNLVTGVADASSTARRSSPSQGRSPASSCSSRATSTSTSRPCSAP